MFDEPSSYLDVKQRLAAARMIRSLSKHDNYIIGSSLLHYTCVQSLTVFGLAILLFHFTDTVQLSSTI